MQVLDKEAISGAIKGATPVAKSGGDVSRLGLPPECPVVPLGYMGDICYYLDANNQLRILKGEKHNALNLTTLFAPQSYLLEELWHTVTKDGGMRFDARAAANALIDACGRIGPVSIENKVRGPGCWLGDDGELVMHCGDAVFSSDGGSSAAGKVGAHVYPSAPVRPHPINGHASGDVAHEVLDYLRTWSWRRPGVDPHLLMGWIGAAMLGAALDWRPLVWITGDKGTGKSTLHDVVERLMGEDGLIATADTTAAGIRQALGNMSLPVAVDELEAEEDNRKQMDVIKLARAACSGAQALRGGADHKGATFVMRSCFMFSSINIPPMMSQDVSRMAILQLDELQPVEGVRLTRDRLKQIGVALRRRLMMRWHDFEKIMHLYQGALQKVGHSARSSAQFGTLLACRDLLLYDTVPDDKTLDLWAGKLDWSQMSEAEDDVPDWQRCFNHLMQSPIDVFKSGERLTVGDWVMRAANMVPGCDPAEASRILSGYGLRVKDHIYTDRPVKVLLVANAHQGLASLFRDTHWGAKSGTSGVWVQSMRRVPNAEAGKASARFNGTQVRYTRMPLDGLISNKDEDTGGRYASAS